MSMQGKYTIQVIAGQYRGKYRTFKEGEIFSTDIPLHLMFVEKFRDVPQTVGVPNADENSLNPHSGRGRFSQIDEGVEVGAGVGERGKFSELDVDFAFASSKDCTHLFTGADIAGYQIFRNVTGFAVMDKYAAVKKNIAPAILQTKKDVAKFLDELGVVVDMNPVPQNTSTSASKQPESLRVPEHADSMNHSDPADSMSISELVNSL